MYDFISMMDLAGMHSMLVFASIALMTLVGGLMALPLVDKLMTIRAQSRWEDPENAVQSTVSPLIVVIGQLTLTEVEFPMTWRPVPVIARNFMNETHHFPMRN